MLAVARAMKARGTRRTLIFAAFDAEEEGLRGAKAFVKSRSLERFALNVNLDMVSRSARREIFVAGTSHTPGLRATVEALQASTPVTIRFGHDRADPVSDDWTLQSDHGAFHEAQIPFLYFGVEDHEDYHKPTDTFDRIDRQFFGDVAALVIDAVAALDRSLP
jgi:Zn-dependent M28 family amino/carboxypeptidase